MPGRQAARSEETRQAILSAAEQLYGARGYQSVTMREIARAAGCSHTAIYIYFQDKEALLHQLAMGPLQSLRSELEAVLLRATLSPDDQLRRMCQIFIQFGFEHRSIYGVLFMAKATRVDLPEPELEVNRLRNQLFGVLRRAVTQVLPPGRSEEVQWAYARALFFTLHGIAALYAGSEEPLDSLLERLRPTFDLAVDMALAGMKQLEGE